MLNLHQLVKPELLPKLPKIYKKQTKYTPLK